MKEGTVNSILSTSRKENVSKRFAYTQKKGGALIRIGTENGVPVLSVNNFKENVGLDEDEYLILPFSRVTGARFVSDWDGIKYYSMGIEKGELPEIEENKLKELKNTMIDGFENFKNKIKEFQHAEEDYDHNLRQLTSNRYNEEDKQFPRQQTPELLKRFSEAKSYIDSYRESFIRMMKGLCRQREKDIDSKIIDEEKRVKEEENSKQRQAVEEFNKDIESLEDKLNVFYSNVSYNFF